MRKARKATVPGKVIAALLAVLVLTAGCSPSKEVALGAKDSGRQIEVKEGEPLVIALESNPTTGYLWEVVESDQRILRQMGETEFQPESDKIGAPGLQTFRFGAQEKGAVTLELVYHRSWEKDVDPLETFSLQVTVR